MVASTHTSTDKSELFTLLHQCVKDKITADSNPLTSFTRLNKAQVRKIPYRLTDGKLEMVERDSYSSSPRLSDPTFRLTFLTAEADSARK